MATNDSPPSNGLLTDDPELAEALGAPEPDTRIEPLDDDIVFDLLRVERRRSVLEYLRNNGGRTTLNDVTERIAADENGVEIAQLTSTQRKRVYIALYQCHLSKLDDAGVVDYNQPRGIIELEPRAAQLYPYMDLDPFEAEDRGTPFDRLKRMWPASEQTR